MLMFFLIVAGLPLVAAFGAHLFLKGVSWKEFLCIAGMALLVSGISAGIVSCSNTADTEIWNGIVTQKSQDSVSCQHSYQCNCRSVSCGKNCSTTTCDTCYEHSHDYDWNVYTSNSEVVTISRIDRQGVYEPARFRSAIIGEPTSVAHSYKNYIKASPGSLFRHQGLKEKYLSSIPEYPVNVYDYYQVDHFVNIGTDIHSGKLWNRDLMEINANLGKSKQVNMIVVLVKDKPAEWFYALEESWIGGKKNDAILVVSVDNKMKPQWAQVMAWTTNEMFKIKLRDDIMDMPKVTREGVMVRLKSNVETFYVRKPMKDFEYLSAQIHPSAAQWIITLLIAFVNIIGLLWIFEKTDIFGDDRRPHWSY